MIQSLRDVSLPEDIFFSLNGNWIAVFCWVIKLDIKKTKLQGKSFQNVGFEIINPFVADISRRYLVHDVLAFHHRSLGFVEGVFFNVRSHGSSA